MMNPLLLFLLPLLFCACGGRQQLKSFNNVITADDSLNIELWLKRKIIGVIFYLN